MVFIIKMGTRQTEDNGSTNYEFTFTKVALYTMCSLFVPYYDYYANLYFNTCLKKY